MNQETGQDFVVFLPLAFGLLWLAATTILAALSGWFTLMSKFPDRPGEPILRVSGQSGSMGLGSA